MFVRNPNTNPISYAMARFISYLRVSTARQGAEGLGVEAQRAAVRSFVGTGELVREFVEVESGRNNSRPVLRDAIAAAKQAGAVLLVARLDRLSRNAAFLLTLQDAGVRFKCCDAPEADEFTVGILALVAQREAQLISARTRAALEAAKHRGTKLGARGSDNLAPHQHKGARARHEKAVTTPENRRAALAAAPLRAQGLSFCEIARRLNAAGFTTREGKAFRDVQVRRVLTLAK